MDKMSKICDSSQKSFFSCVMRFQLNYILMYYAKFMEIYRFHLGLQEQIRLQCAVIAKNVF